MSTQYTRRQFLTRIWKWAIGLVAAAGAWTSWDLLRPAARAGTGPIRTVAPDAVPDVGVLEIPEMRGYLTKVDNEIVALWWKCPHLGCKVPWCESSGQFECPCHGSVFNRIGEYRRGPAPRGMDRFEWEEVDGFVVVDPDQVTTGAAPGAETINEPPTGPECLDASGEA